MRELFLDMEFTGLHQGTTPISLALLESDGKRGLYAEFTDYDHDQIDAWLKEHVLAHLQLRALQLGEECWMDFSGPVTKYVGPAYGPNEENVYLFRDVLTDFLTEKQTPAEDVVIWVDCGAYDWMLFNQLFGGGPECLPKNVSYIPLDLCTLLWVGDLDPDLDRRSFGNYNGSKHNALDDVRAMIGCVRHAQNFVTAAPGIPGKQVPWRSLLDERQQKELALAELYARDFRHGTTGHNQLMLIAKLAGILDLNEPPTGEAIPGTSQA